MTLVELAKGDITEYVTIKKVSSMEMICLVGMDVKYIHTSGHIRKEQTMSDTIYRQEAIDAIYEHEFSNWCDKDEVSTILNDLPSADRPQGECLKEAEILLKATRNLLNKQNESIYVLNMLEETVIYYGVECDGLCLIEDIDAWLELYGSEKGADDDRI